MLMEYCSIKVEMNEREKDINMRVIRFLLEHGANPHLKSKKNKTSFDYAKKHQFKDDVLDALKST